MPMRQAAWRAPEETGMQRGRLLPEPSADARAHSASVVRHIAAEIGRRGGWIPFADYMRLALYAPGLGYYSAGSRKLGAAGDFVTAPELTPLFGHALAQVARPLIAAGLVDLLEIGAGSGALAAAILDELDRAGTLPEHYFILEVSPDLRVRERDLLASRVPHLLERVVWLNRLPPTFRGLVLGNEVLDAMPVEVVRVTHDAVETAGVQFDATRDAFEWSYRAAPADLAATARAAVPAEALDDKGYITELGLEARAFTSTVASIVDRGVMLFIDYGFPAREFYHPERSMGTLRGHYRHHALDDPFWLPGLVDLTAHVDFSAIAAAGVEGGMQLAGYTSQAGFLIDCDITGLLSRTPPEDAARYLPMANAVRRLLDPSEMGELFKAIAFTRGVDAPVIGFRRGDRRGAL